MLIRLLRLFCVASRTAAGSAATFAQPSAASEYVLTANVCYGYARFASAVLVQAKLRPAQLALARAQFDLYDEPSQCYRSVRSRPACQIAVR